MKRIRFTESKLSGCCGKRRPARGGDVARKHGVSQATKQGAFRTCAARLKLPRFRRYRVAQQGRTSPFVLSPSERRDRLKNSGDQSPAEP